MSLWQLSLVLSAASALGGKIHWDYYGACYWTEKYSKSDVEKSCAWEDKVSKITIQDDECPSKYGKLIYEATHAMNPPPCGPPSATDAASALGGKIHWDYYGACYWTEKYSKSDVEKSCAWEDKVSKITIQDDECPSKYGKFIYEATHAMNPPPCGPPSATDAASALGGKIHWDYYGACYWTEKYSKSDVEKSCAWEDKVSKITIQDNECPSKYGKFIYEATHAMHPPPCGPPSVTDAAIVLGIDDAILV